MRSLLFAFCMLGTAFGQGRVSYSDPSGQLSLKFTGFSYVLGKAGVTRWTLSGSPVYAANPREGLELWAGHALIETAQARGAANAIRTATLTGGVRTVKTGSGGRAEMSGANAKYAASGSAGRVDVSGSVRLSDTNNGRTLVATGSSLTANVSVAKSSRPLRTATLSGGVKVDVQQSAGSRLSATASRMTLDYLSTPARLTLSGNVRMNGLQNGGVLQGSVPRVTLFLNAKGEVERMEGGS